MNHYTYPGEAGGNLHMGLQENAPIFLSKIRGIILVSPHFLDCKREKRGRKGSRRQARGA